MVSKMTTKICSPDHTAFPSCHPENSHTPKTVFKPPGRFSNDSSFQPRGHMSCFAGCWAFSMTPAVAACPPTEATSEAASEASEDMVPLSYGRSSVAAPKSLDFQTFLLVPNGGTSQLDGLCHGKSHLEMDEN